MFKTSPASASTLTMLAAARRVPLDRPASAGASRLFLSAGVLAALAAAALLVDLPLARALDSLDIPYDFRHLVRLGESFGWGGSVALIILAAALLDPRGWRVIPRLAVMAFGSGLLADGIKLLIARRRPVVIDLAAEGPATFLGWRPGLAAAELARIGDDGSHSFPSGHAATAAGLAVALAVLYPRGRWLFLGLAALAAFQRIEVQAHFASDVLAGAALGCLVGGLCQLDFGLGRLITHLESPK
jgi:membrane-associated phospholipid phosphatase